MYCPQCATPNPDDVKFCRSCGRELEAVALILSGKPPHTIKKDTNKIDSKTEQDWVEKHVQGVSGITRGSILLAVSLMIGAAMGLFLQSSLGPSWILIWMVFFGWLAVWGGIEMAYGISSMQESKSRLRLLKLAGDDSDAIPKRLSAGEPSPIMNPSAFQSSPPLSVTDGTTRQLEDNRKK